MPSFFFIIYSTTIQPSAITLPIIITFAITGMIILNILFMRKTSNSFLDKDSITPLTHLNKDYQTHFHPSNATNNCIDFAGGKADFIQAELIE